MFKPDAVMRGVVGEILSRFEKVGLKIIGAKMVVPSESQLHGHYEGIGGLKTRKGEEVFGQVITMMQVGPLFAVVLEGVEAVELVRKMVGPTEPKSAQPGTIRGDYAHISYGHANTHGTGVPNLIHASADSAEAAKEITHWFAEDELYEYSNVHERFTQPRAR
jgi:nucleoside-diphosphate kinase